MTTSNLEHARRLAELSASEVRRARIDRRSWLLPDPQAALRGMETLAAAGELKVRTARRFVVGLWALLAPHPMRAVPVEVWP
jgi:hypothetical protein